MNDTTESTESEPLQLPVLTAKTEYSEFSVRVHSIAWSSRFDGPTQAGRRRSYSNGAGLVCLSATGPDTAIKAIRAILYADTACCMTLASPDSTNHWPYRIAKAQIAGDQVKYTASVAKLDKGVVHLVAIAKIPGLIVNLSDDHLWKELQGERYTTPMLRHWTEKIGKVLAKKGMLAKAEGWQTNAGILRVEPEELDKIVSNGVHRGFLKMEIA